MTDNRMRLNLHNKKTGLTLILRHDEGLTSQDVLDAYRLVNRESHDELTIKLDGKTIAGNMAPTMTVDEVGNIEPKGMVETKEEAKSRPKAFDMVGSERSLNTPLGEIADFSHFNDRVLVAIDCPKCGYSGDIKVPETFKFSKCPTCNLKLFNSWAAGAPGQTDEAGYAFYANSEMVFKNYDEDGTNE